MNLQKVIYSDLDGTLLDHQSYSYTKASQSLHQISDLEIPLVLVSSKTAAEIIKIITDLNRENYKINHPFVCENGSAIYLPKNYFSSDLTASVNYPIESKKKYDLIKISQIEYSDLVKNLKKIAGNITGKIIGFNDLTVKQLSTECGLSPEAAKLAKLRQFDEPFKIQPNNPSLYNQIEALIKQANLNYTRGGRYAHIMGRQDKGLAVRILTKLFKQQSELVTTYGFGDSQNDLEFLKFCDQGYLVANPQKSSNYEANSNRIKKIPEIGPAGFNKTTLSILS